MHINDIINTTAYDFLRIDERLKDNIIFLTFGGSHAYGTNTPDSDIDIRGCCIPLKSDLLGLASLDRSPRFEQFTDPITDTTIYTLGKLIPLLLSCNPNTIELLGCKTEHYTLMTENGRLLIENRKLFLSKEAVHSFGGYANQQLRRLQNALARDAYGHDEKEVHILNAIKSSMRTFDEKYKSFPEGSIELFIGESDKTEFESEILMNINLENYPLRDYRAIWAEMQSIVKVYGKVNHRNNKKDDNHLNKHAMHLVRLYLMCFDILEKGEINTYRGNDLELLRKIRSGGYQKDDSTYHREFFELVTDYEKRLKYAADYTDLPDKPDYGKVEELVMTINEKVVIGDG